MASAVLDDFPGGNSFGLQAALAILDDPAVGCHPDSSALADSGCRADAAAVVDKHTALLRNHVRSLDDIRPFASAPMIVGYGVGEPCFRDLAAIGRVVELQFIHGSSGERAYAFAIRTDRPDQPHAAVRPYSWLDRFHAGKAMPVVEYVGHYRHTTGYAYAARSHIRALLAAGVTVRGRPVGIRSAEIIDDDTLTVDRETTPATVQILNMPPQLWAPRRDVRLPAIGHCVWETDRPCDADIAAIRESGVSEVWVPTEHNRRIFSAALDMPVRVVPHVVEAPRAVRAFPAPLLGVPPLAFVFLTIAEWQTRKGLDALIRAFVVEFAGDGDASVALVIKSGGPGDVLAGRIDGVMRGELGFAPQGPYVPQVVGIGRDMDADEIAGLHARADCYVSAHRAEGWGLPITDAMRFGKPVIATAQGGPAEFVPKEWLVGGRSVPVEDTPPYYAAPQRWAEPSISGLRRQMRRVYEMPISGRNAHGARNARIVERFSVSRVGALMRRYLRRFA